VAATRLLCDWAFRELRLTRIELLVEPTNVPSHRVAERLGAVADGLTQHAANDGGICEMVKYSLSALATR
jgi:RimJ/RimL family protein N-acetyltransferase